MRFAALFAFAISVGSAHALGQQGAPEGSRAVAPDPDMPLELMAAVDEVLVPLTEQERAWAQRLSQGGARPRLDASRIDQLKKGAWGELTRIEKYDFSRPVPAGAVTADSAAGYTALHANQLKGSNTFTDFDVSEIVDDHRMLIFDYKLWVEGIDTTSLTDESNVDLRGRAFEVIGTKRYETVRGGTRTVLRLVAMDAGKAGPAALKLQTLQQYRVWKDDKGAHSLLARYIGFKGGNVTLERLDGKQADVPIVRLGKDEQKFVREAVKAAGTRKPKKSP